MSLFHKKIANRYKPAVYFAAFLLFPVLIISLAVLQLKNGRELDREANYLKLTVMPVEGARGPAFWTATVWK